MADRLITAATAFFLLGTLGLYGYSIEMEPGRLGSGGGVGSYIFLEGQVRQVRKGWGGLLRAEVLADGKLPGVWLEADEALMDVESVRSAMLTGARVRAEGILEEYKGVREMRLADPGDLSILAPSSLQVISELACLLNNTNVSFQGIAFYKHLSGDYLTFRLVDPVFPGREVNCSADWYRLSDEKRPWENGTAVIVMGKLKYRGNPLLPRIYLTGGAAGVEVPD